MLGQELAVSPTGVLDKLQRNLVRQAPHIDPDDARHDCAHFVDKLRARWRIKCVVDARGIRSVRLKLARGGGLLKIRNKRGVDRDRLH